MIEVLPESTDSCVGIRVSGNITGHDYGVFRDRVQSTIKKHGKVNLVVVFDHFKFYEDWDVFTADLGFATDDYRKIERAAYVGDTGWEKMLLKLTGPFTHTHERHFRATELQEAWNWAKGES